MQEAHDRFAYRKMIPVWGKAAMGFSGVVSVRQPKCLWRARGQSLTFFFTAFDSLCRRSRAVTTYT